MKGHWRCVFLSVATSLAGCAAITPDYQRPADAIINTPDAGKIILDSHTPQISTKNPSGHWWALYRSNELDALVEQALAANTDLRVAAANLNRAEAGLAVSRDARLPQLGLEAGPAYARDSAEEQLVPGPLENHRVYELAAAVTYQIDLFGQISRTIEAAGSNVDAAKAAVAATRITVVAQTVGAYLGTCAAGREIKVAERVVQLQTEGTDLAHRRFSQGRTASLDETRSKAQEDQLRATLPPLTAQKEQELYRLAVLTGKPPGSVRLPVASCDQEPEISQAIPVGDGRALLARRPDVALAEARLHESVAKLGVVTADLYPKITLGASGGSVGLMRNFLSDDTYKFSIGPLITWEFPNRKRAHAEVRGAQADVDAAFARFDASVLTALDEVDSALSAYAHDLQRERLLAGARNSAAKASADARALYGAGRQGYLSVLDADRQLASVDQLIASVQTKVASDQVQLFLALGGGWQ